MLPGGAFRAAVDGYYNPIPPRPGGVEIKRYTSGSPSSTSSWQSANSNNQYTNWDQSLNQASTDPGDLVVYITDGDPTAYDFDRPGDPFSPGPPPDVGVGTDRNATVAGITLERAVEGANQIKNSGARVLALGVGEALQDQASVDRLTQISGPDVARSIGEFDVETTDVALVADFDDLAAAVRGLVLDLCSPSLTIRKFAQSASDASYQPADGWDIEVTPTVGGGFDWVLPAGATGPTASDATSGGGFAQFQWEPLVEDAVSAALVEEDLSGRPDFVPGRPGPDNDYRCEFKNADGDVRVASGELTDGGATASFSLSGIGNEIGTCSVYNSFVPTPAIALTKLNSPTRVRGDLDPPATVRSDYSVTNPGNTPLSDVAVLDDNCAPVQPVTQGSPNGAFNVGDDNRDGHLDLTEDWEFFCERDARASGRASGPITVVNTAVARGTDPSGTVVTDEATDDVDIYIPEIVLTKLVNGADAVTVSAGTAVQYTYEATNIGNTPLASVGLVDDTPPCVSPTPADQADGDAVMQPGETWTWVCDALPDSAVVNTATVTGTPLDPTTNEFFPMPNPVVTAVDTAEVSVVDPGLTLTKTVDASIVFPGDEVTYDYAAENTGTSDLRNDTGDPGWVQDDVCADVLPVPAAGPNSGDLNDDGLLNPGETWRFTCSMPLFTPTLNTATIVAQPIDGGGQPIADPLEREDVAFVAVVEPGIALVKTALVPVVLDTAADPVLGPDVPTVRPAEYLYEVTNTGDVPLRGVALVDDRCASPVLADGDVDADVVLDPSEVWVYTCTTTLTRSQGTPPPAGAESGIVTNTAQVTGVPFLPTQPVIEGPVQQATDTAQVLVIQPGISITKTPSADVVVVDSAVTYTFAVTNTGDVSLAVIGPLDDKCAGLTYTGGDIDGNDLLDGANSGQVETWTFECTRSVPLPAPPEQTDVNEVAVLGIDPLGNVYAATDTAEVTVLDLAIDLVKSVSDHLVLTGSRVTYDFEVTNVGRSPIAGDDVLAEISLADASLPRQPDCEVPALVSKTGGNQDELLDRDPPELWTYRCAATIDAPTVDLAGVEGIGGTTLGLRLPVFAFDAQYVQNFTPGISIVKTADPTTTAPGGPVTYSYAVRNTGDVPLSDVAERITDDTCSPVRYASGDLDGDGLLDTPDSIFEDALDEVWVFTCATTVTVTTINTAVVTGTATDPDGRPLCDAVDVAPAPGEPTCEPTARDQAVVVVTGLLPDTGGAPAWPLLGVGALLILVGLAVRGVRRGSNAFDR